MDQFNFNNFPDTNFNEVNLSWMLEVISQFKEDLESGQFVGPQGPQGPQGEPGPAGDGITEEVKQALLQLARKVAYVDAGGQTYYQDLYNALYGLTPTELVSISAVYTQAGTVYDTDSLDSLKADLIVTATYSDSSTAVIPAADYMLSGSLTAGTSTITVSYQGKTASFQVTVTSGGVTLVSISAIYTQSGVVYDTDSLDSLKPDLVVTATYSDSTTATVPSADYTLSGTLTAGTSTITVSYGGKTTTFSVTVSAAPSYVTNGLIHQWDAINNTRSGHDASVNTWEDLVGTNDLTVNNYSNITWLDNAVRFTGVTGTRFLGSEASTDAAGKTVEVVFSVTTAQTATICTMFHSTQYVNYAYGKITLYSDSTFGVKGQSDKTYTIGSATITDFHSISASYSAATTAQNVFANAQTATLGTATHSMSTSSVNPSVGGCPNNYDYPFSGKVHAIRIYDRILTAEEVAQNYAVDVFRFNLG